MSLLTPSDYFDFTGDSQSGRVQFCLDWAEKRLEEYLGRYIQHGQYTETLELNQFGKAYPAAVPVTEVAASAGVSMIGDDCMDFGPQWPEYDMIIERYNGHTVYVTRTVVYSGGFTIVTLPESLREAICGLTFWKLHTKYDPSDPKGSATQIRVGDVALGFDRSTRGNKLEAMVPGITGMIKGLHLGRL